MKKEESSLRILTGYIFFLAAACLIFLIPLVLNDGYADVDILKFNVYKWVIIIGYGLSGLLAIVTCISEHKKIERPRSSVYFAIGYLLVTVISVMVSQYRQYTVWGFDGWFMGLFAQVSFMVIYILHGYFDRYRKMLLNLLMIVSIFVYLFGILHRFNIDFLDTYRLGTSMEMPVHFRMQFLSTIGQATWYSSFVAVSMAVIAGLYILSEKKWQSIMSGVVMTMGFMTLISQNSDSAYMAMLGIFTVYLCYVCSQSDNRYVQRFIDMIIMFFAATRLMSIGCSVLTDEELYLDKISTFLIFNILMWHISILITGILVYIRIKVVNESMDFGKLKRFKNIYLITLISVITFACILLLLDVLRVLPESITNITYKLPYLHWSDFWGSGRGKTWTFSLKMFGGMDILHKLFGVGPDAYFYEAYSKYGKELEILWPQDTVSCAHNEWLNSLICQGVLGVVCYTGIFITTIKEKMKLISTNPNAVVSIAVAVGYICHNFFCYQQVCSTPFVFMLMS